VKTTLCLYHADADGACSAWVVRKVHPDAECMPVKYGDAVPLDLAKGRLVYVVDFSYPVDELRALTNAANGLIVIDHHKTGRDRLRAVEFGPDVECYFDERRAGCGLTWDTLFPGKPRPWWVDYVEDRDLWRFDLPDSKAVNAYLASLPFGPETYDVLSPLHAAARNRAPRDVIAAGEAILRYQRQQVETFCRQAYRAQLPRVHPYQAVVYDGDFQDLRGSFDEIPIANTPALISEVGNALAIGEPFSATWYLRADGRVRWSLRSVDGGADVSEIAKLYGGGGHKHAAGFHTSIEDLKDSLP
jgi:oligoribonuclease NrnB/cAMP/cGMP phosphodiesterase (DHH superfamily)